MRAALLPLLHTRVTAVGTLTDGRKFNLTRLDDVRVEGAGEAFTHIWTKLPYEVMARPLGSRIRFAAYVERYTRSDGTEDFGLMCLHVEEE